MSSVLPPALTELIEAFGSLPGVGPRTAERYAYYVARRSNVQSNRLAQALLEVHQGISYCKKTFAFVPAGQEISDLYTDPKRDKKIIAVVAEPFDIIALEKTGHFLGTYHVLGGLISPIDGVTPDVLHTRELVNRVKEDGVTEIILALSAGVEGETTALYVQKELEGTPVTITRLARGLPVGVDLEYADQITLGHALSGRTSL